MIALGGCILMSSMTQRTVQSEQNSTNSLVGKICNSTYSYFDVREQKYKYKLRPVLIVGTEKDRLPCDITVLPVSKISRAENISVEYDYPLTKINHGLLRLKNDPSYIRIHKISTIHSKDLSFQTDHQLNILYPETYANIKGKLNDFVAKLG